MTTLKSEWNSTKPNPDEGFLRTLWQADLANLEKSCAAAGELALRQDLRIQPLLKAAGLTKEAVNKLVAEDAERSKKPFDAAVQLVAKPPVDFEPLHQQDVERAKSNEKQILGHNPSWQGYIWSPSYGGWWSAWNGEAEEVPSTTFDFANHRFDPRAQAHGGGWWDEDFSGIHSYFAFTFNPPSWGHLHIYIYPWLHGYYRLYSDDAWYKGEWARAELDTWVDVYQNFWRAREYRRRFTMAGYELHPEQYGRIDSQYIHSYYTNVGASDAVTIRVGTRLYCAAQASGGRSSLDFQTGAANCVYVPYVYWYLHN